VPQTKTSPITSPGGARVRAPAESHENDAAETPDLLRKNPARMITGGNLLGVREDKKFRPVSRALAKEVPKHICREKKINTELYLIFPCGKPGQPGGDFAMFPQSLTPTEDRITTETVAGSDERKALLRQLVNAQKVLGEYQTKYNDHYKELQKFKKPVSGEDQAGIIKNMSSVIDAALKKMKIESEGGGAQKGTDPFVNRLSILKKNLNKAKTSLGIT